jgi:hypothetical protein
MRRRSPQFAVSSPRIPSLELYVYCMSKLIPSGKQMNDDTQRTCPHISMCRYIMASCSLPSSKDLATSGARNLNSQV